MGHKPWVAVLLCCVLLGFFSGVSLGDADEEVLVLQPDADGIQRAFIVLDSYAFTPPHISVQAGLPIELQLENQSFLTPHNFVIDYPDVALRHDVSVDAGDSVTIRFSVQTPGRTPFIVTTNCCFSPAIAKRGWRGVSMFGRRVDDACETRRALFTA